MGGLRNSFLQWSTHIQVTQYLVPDSSFPSCFQLWGSFHLPQGAHACSLTPPGLNQTVCPPERVPCTRALGDKSGLAQSPAPWEPHQATRAPSQPISSEAGLTNNTPQGTSAPVWHMVSDQWVKNWEKEWSIPLCEIHSHKRVRGNTE